MALFGSGIDGSTLLLAFPFAKGSSVWLALSFPAKKNFLQGSCSKWGHVLHCPGPKLHHEWMLRGGVELCSVGSYCDIKMIKLMLADGTLFAVFFLVRHIFANAERNIWKKKKYVHQKHEERKQWHVQGKDQMATEGKKVKRMGLRLRANILAEKFSRHVTGQTERMTRAECQLRINS